MSKVKLSQPIKLEVGDKVISLENEEGGIITRLGKYEAAFVRWDKDNSQEMVKISSLKRRQ